MNCVLHVVRVSGTIKKAEEDVVRRARREIVKAKMTMEGRADDLLQNLLGPETKTVNQDGRAEDVEGIEDYSEDEGMEDESD